MYRIFIPVNPKSSQPLYPRLTVMGNETSVEDIPGVRLLEQDADNLWTIIHQEEGEEEEGAGEGEEVCLFTRVPGKGDQAELCRAGVNVRKKSS